MAQAAVPPPPVVRRFRTRTSLIVCAAWLVVAALWLFLELRGGVDGSLRVLPFVFAASVLVFALFGRPRVEVHPDRVGLIGVVRDVWVPFRALAEVSERFSFTLIDGDGRSFAAWALPVVRKAPRTSVTADRMRRPAGPGDEDWIARDGSSTEPGAARLAVLARWRIVLSATAPPTSAPVQVRRAWLLPGLAGAGALIGALLAVVV